jgi:hypothetical protein
MHMLKMHLFISLTSFGLLAGCGQVQPNSVEIAPPASKTEVVAGKGMQADIAGLGKPTCPGNDFLSFLQAFAADDEVRVRFTMPSVLVTDWRDPNETQDGTTVTPVEKAAYRGFTLRYLDSGFHDVGPDGVVDPEPSKIDITKHGEDYEVRYVYNMSEGNSWIFRSKGGCWYLAEDPEPSDP